jgi:hypothetical protein
VPGTRPFMPTAGHQALPEDIAGPLKLAPGCAGQVIVWAHRAVPAAHRLHLLGLLDEPDPRDVAEAPTVVGSVALLDRAQDWYSGTVLAFGLFGDSPIVSIDFGRGPSSSYDNPNRKVTVVGGFRTGATVVDLDAPEATRTQVAAAMGELPGWLRRPGTARLMRAAVTAALRAPR